MANKSRELPKVRNPEARALAHPLFRNRVVPSKKAYKRRDRNQKEQGE